MQRKWSRPAAVSLATVLMLALPGSALGQSAVPSEGSQGGALSVAFLGDPGPLDPSQGYDQTSWMLERLLWDTLVTYDEGTTIVPALAAALPTISDDGLTYTFDLRPDANFVQGGEVLRPVTADDVVFSLNRLLRPDVTPSPSPIGPAFFSVISGAADVLSGAATEATGLVAVDEDTVQITLDRADRTFLNALAMPFGSVVPADLAGIDTAAFAAAPVGSGPYTLESYTSGERAVFRRNPHYWRAGYPKADTIEARFGVTAESQVLQAQSNLLDLMGDQITSADWPTVSTDPSVADRIVASDVVQTFFLAMDTSGPDSPFADPLVRRAVNHAIDKQNQVRIVNGRATVAGCIMPAVMPGFDPACDPYPYSVETAQALMDQAGNAGFSTTLYTTNSEISQLAAEAIATDLAKIGIEVEVSALDFGTLMGVITTPHAAPLVYTGWYQDFPDPSDFIDPILSCATAVQGGSNLAWYCNEAVDAQAAEARTIPDLQVAIPEYQDIERQIMADAPWVPLVYPRWTVLRSDRVPSVTSLHPVWFWDLATYPVTE